MPLLNEVEPMVEPTIGGRLSNRFWTVMVRSRLSLTGKRVARSNQL